MSRVPEPPQKGPGSPHPDSIYPILFFPPPLPIPGHLILFGLILRLNVPSPRPDLSVCLPFLSTCSSCSHVPRIHSLITICPTTLWP